MNTPATDPQAVKLSASFYNLLLASYPTRFRQEYGPHMLQVFRDCCRKAYQHRRPARDALAVGSYVLRLPAKRD